jgi:predicted ATPase
VQARILILQGDLPEAETSLLRAIGIAQTQKARFWELRASLDLARIWLDQRKKKEAKQLLSGIYDWFTEGFETVDLKEAKALLDKL